MRYGQGVALVVAAGAIWSLMGLMLRQIEARAIALAVAVQHHGADVVPQFPERVAQPAKHLFGHRVVLFGTV